MDDEPEVIRQQMEDTRSALTDKIEQLENQVIGTMQDTTQAVTDTVASVKEAVQDTVTSVKDTVSDTVGSVKNALDVRGYVEESPWASFGVAVAAGFVGGMVVGGGHKAVGRIADQHSHGEATYSNGRSVSNGERRFQTDYAPTAPVQSGPSWMDRLMTNFAPEIDKLKGLAIGALGALVRDTVAQSATGQIGDRLTQMIDEVTRKAGGEPIRGPLLGDTCVSGKTSRERDATSEARPGRVGFAG